MDSGLPHLGNDTIEARAARAGRTWEARQRARREVADEFETIDNPDEIPIRRRGRRLGPGQEFLERAEPQEAAHQLDPEFPRQDLGAQDVRRTEQGFAPREDVVRQDAAFGFEERTPLEDVDPQQDLEERGGGFGLTEPRQRDIAAQDLDPQLPGVDLGRQDVAPAEGGGYRPTESAQRQQAASDLDPMFPGVDLGAGDIEREGGDQWGLTTGAERAVAAGQLEEQTPLGEIDPQDDIRRADDGGGWALRDSVLEENRGLFF